MTPEQIEKMVQHDLVAFEAAPPKPGPTVGIPWSTFKVQESIAALRASLVTPYSQRFVVKDTGEQMRMSPPQTASYWVVAEAEPFLEFYDPETREYGLAMRSRDGIPQTIGVRGDLIGVFGAM